jgi:hypothetical protein
LRVSVFIGYGGTKAAEVANSLNVFLKLEELDTFLAAPRSHTLISGTTNFQKEIEQNIIASNIIVFVCHDGTCDSKPAKKEIDFISDHNLFYKMILFSKSDNCIPKKAQCVWHPLHFPPEKPEESFCRLLNEIFRSFISITAPVSIERESKVEA